MCGAVEGDEHAEGGGLGEGLREAGGQRLVTQGGFDDGAGEGEDLGVLFGGEVDFWGGGVGRRVGMEVGRGGSSGNDVESAGGFRCGLWFLLGGTAG